MSGPRPPFSSFEPVQEVEIVCPYCGETVTIVVEADLAGELVQDCEVCCSPWRLRLTRRDQRLVAEAARLDE